MKIYSGPVSMFGAKVQIAAAEKGLEFDLEMVPFTLWAAQRYDPVHPEVARINPKGQVPVVVDGSLELFDSTQIFEYFEDLRPTPALWPASIRDRARARLLELRSDEVFFPAAFQKALAHRGEPDHPEAVQARATTTAFYEEMERQLAGREYLAGGFSYADIAFYMASLFGERMGAPLTGDAPNLLRWRDRMTDRPAVQQVVKPMVAFLTSQGRPLPHFLSRL